MKQLSLWRASQSLDPAYKNSLTSMIGFRCS